MCDAKKKNYEFLSSALEGQQQVKDTRRGLHVQQLFSEPRWVFNTSINQTLMNSNEHCMLTYRQAKQSMK